MINSGGLQPPTLPPTTGGYPPGGEGREDEASRLSFVECTPHPKGLNVLSYIMDPDDLSATVQ